MRAGQRFLRNIPEAFSLALLFPGTQWVVLKSLGYGILSASGALLQAPLWVFLGAFNLVGLSTFDFTMIS